MKIGDIVFQGDVGLRRIAKMTVPADFKLVPRDEHDRVVLAYGETSGHAHVFRAPGVCMLRREGTGERVITLDLDAELLHDMGGATVALTGEHAPIDVPAGTYEVIQQCEWVGQGVQR